MYTYLNLNPNGKETRDCVKRAISKETGIDYKSVQKELNSIKRDVYAEQFNDRIVTDTYLKKYNYKKLSFPAIKGQSRMNGEKFCNAYKTGSYILNMAGHWTACVNGVIYDTWDCTQKCVYTAYYR